MPRGKKNIVISSQVKVEEPKNGNTTLKSFLFRIRDICRNNGVQMDENGNIYADLIYDDLLFLKDLWKLVETNELSIDLNFITQGTHLKSIQLAEVASLKNSDASHLSDIFNRIWTQLQRSKLKNIFDREFALKSILKDEQLKSKYLPLLSALLEYVGNIQLEEHEDTDPYEYFSEDLKKAKSTYFGQFYTPQHVTESCVNEIQPKFGEIGLDPAAGTSKFMRTAAHYISKNENISEWDAFNRMESVEIESKVHRQGILGTFIKYKKLADMNKIRKGNAFNVLLKEDKQYDYILGNPPYGGTVDGFDTIYYIESSETKGKRIIKKKIINPEIKHPLHIIKKDTSVLFLQLIVNKLKDRGRAAVVFNGTIMNDQHRDVMKWFLNCCDLCKIIVNPSGSFKNTNIETYSLIFWKGSPTQKIEYYEVNTKKKLGEFTRKQLEENNWDIRPIFHAIKQKDSLIKYSSISEVCLVKHGNIQASKSINGPYNCYSGAEEVSTHNESSFVGPAVIYVNGSSGSKGRVHYAKHDEKFAATTLVQVLTPIDNKQIDMKYLWYYFRINKESILEMFKSSNMRETIQVNDFVKYTIPLPPLETQQQIVSTLDRIFADPQDMKDCLAFTDKAMDLMLKDPTGLLLEDVLGGIRLKRNHLKNIDSIKTQMASVMKSVGMRGYERKKLEDLCKVLFGERITQKDNTGTIYPVYGSGGDTFRTDKHNRLGKTCKIGRFALSESNMVMFVNGPYWLMDSGFTVESKNTELILTEYLWYSLLTDKKRLATISTGSCQKNIDMEEFYKLEYSCPPLETQQQILTILNEMEGERKSLEQMASKAEERAKFVLDGYLS